MSEITIKQMMEAGLHFGHQTKRWNPKMRKYIFGSRNGIYIIDLQKTLKLFNKAIDFVKEIAANGGTVLFIGTKTQAQDIIDTTSRECGMPCVKERWLGGMLTNFDTIQKSVGRLRELETMTEDGSLKVLAKKEAIRLTKEQMKLERYLGGIKDMPGLPDAVFIVDTKKERIALAEALKLKIPVIAIVDTNCDPDGIEYVIPGNDDASRAISLVAGAIKQAILDGAEEHKMKVKALAEEKAKAAEELKRKEAQAAAQAATSQAGNTTPQEEPPVGVSNEESVETDSPEQESTD